MDNRLQQDVFLEITQSNTINKKSLYILMIAMLFSGCFITIFLKIQDSTDVELDGKIMRYNHPFF